MIYYYKLFYHQSLIFFQRCFDKAYFEKYKRESTLCKTCSYRTPTSLKRDFAQVFPYEIANSLFIEHLWTTYVKTVYITEQLFQRISQIDRKLPVLESFILLLQARKLAFLLKKISSNMLPCKFDEAFQKNILTEHFTSHKLPYCKYWLIF